jgi:transposase-like protein
MSSFQAQLMSATLRKVLKRLHYPLEIMLVGVRWYAAYPLSLRNLEEMMAERGVGVDHATVHRWAAKILRFCRVSDDMTRQGREARCAQKAKE